MVIKQYNAKGPVTETLLSAVALIAFGFALAIAGALNGGADGSAHNMRLRYETLYSAER